MSINKLRIPERQKEDFKFFLNLPKEVQDELISFIQNIPFGMSNKSLIDYAFEKITNLSRDNIIKILSIYFSLSSAKEELEYGDDEFINNLSDSLDELDDEDLKLNEISLNTLSIMFNSQNKLSKSRSIIREYNINNNNYENSKITIDIRPVFDSENTLLGSAIISNLKILYINNEEENNFFVSLDENDINELIKILNSTKEKIKHIKENFTNLEIVDIKK